MLRLSSVPDLKPRVEDTPEFASVKASNLKSD